MRVSVSVYVCTHVYSCPQWPEEGARSPEVGVTGNCELLGIGTVGGIF